MRASVFTAVIAWGAVAAIGPARAQPIDRTALSLDWQAPPGCPDAASMESRIVDMAGGIDQARGSARARAAERPDGGWLVEVDVGDGPRVLVGDSCREVARAAALVIGIALRTASELGEAPRIQAGDREVPWREPGYGRAALEARLERPPPSRWRPAVDAQAGAAIGALPDPAPLVRVGLAARRGAFALRGEAAAASARRGLLLEDEEIEAVVRTDLLAATASGCYVAGWLWLCGGIEAGAMRARASAGAARVTGSGAWVAAHAGPTAALPLSGTVHLLLEAEGVVPLAHPVFSVNGVELPGAEPVSLRTGAGIRVAFP